MSSETYEKLKDSSENKFTVLIEKDVYDKIYHWIDKTDHEVSGFGNVIYDEEKQTFTVTTAILLEQENEPTSSEIDGDALAVAMYETRGQEGALKWWWHSHVNMNVFWSADDMECIRSLGQRGWILSTVFNKKRDARSSFYTTVEVMGERQELFVDECENKILTPMADPELAKAWDEEYDAKVSIAKTNYLTNDYGNKDQGGYESWDQQEWDEWYEKSENYEKRQGIWTWCGHKKKAHPNDNVIDATPKLMAKQLSLAPGLGETEDKRGIIQRFDEDNMMLWASMADENPQWSDHGECKLSNGDQLYNPYRDNTIESLTERYKDIVEMSADEQAQLLSVDDGLYDFIMDWEDSLGIFTNPQAPTNGEHPNA